MTKQAKNAASHAASLADSLRQARAQLDTLDREVEDLNEQRRAIEHAPPTRDEAKAAASARINKAAAEGRERLGRVAGQFARGRGDDWDPAAMLVDWSWAAESYRPNTAVLLALHARELEQHVLAAIDADARFDNGISADERAHRLAALDDAIADAEQRRDDLIAEFDAAGLQLREAADEPVEDSGGDNVRQRDNVIHAKD